MSWTKDLSGLALGVFSSIFLGAATVSGVICPGKQATSTLTELSHTPEEQCKNCARPLRPQDKYCPGCGQKKYHGPPTLWGLFSELFETVFNLDNRLFKTLRDLPIPGELTIKYLAGKQRPFFRPLRLFFVATVLMLSAYTILAVDQIGESFDASVEEARASAYHRVFERELAAELDTLQDEFPDPRAVALLDTIHTRFLSDSRDSISIGYLEFKQEGAFEGRELRMDLADYHTALPQEIPELYGVAGWFNQYQVSQIIAINRSGARGIANLMGQLIWGVLLLIPLSALMLKIIYIRRKRTYMEHLVFSLHVHAFLFLFQALAAIVLYGFATPVLLWVSIGVTVLYFVVAQKRVYRQGWIKTLVKAFVLFLGYNLILSVALGIGALMSMLLY